MGSTQTAAERYKPQNKNTEKPAVRWAWENRAPSLLSRAPGDETLRSALVEALDLVPQNSYFLQRASVFMTDRSCGRGLG